MIWKKITIDTTVEATDIVASVLFDNSIIGAEIEDNQNLSSDDLSKMYVDIPKINIDDGKSKVSFYISIGDKDEHEEFSADRNLVDNSYIPSKDNVFTKEEFDAILTNIKLELEDYRNFLDMGPLTISETLLDDKVFLNKWKENFKKLEIDDITILPSWEKNSAKSGTNIYIEPGNAFGTGRHSTTKLCIMAIKKVISSINIDNFLDVGMGSGILSIIAMKLGAKNIYGIDIDKSVEMNLLENLELNCINGLKISEDNDENDSESVANFQYTFGNILTDEWLKNKISKQKYDVIVANILAPVIISLLDKGKISSYLNSNGYLILSGIIKEREDDIIASIKNDKNILSYEVYREDEWVMFLCRT